LILSMLVRKPPLHSDQASGFVFTDDAVDFMIMGKAAKLMMAEPAFWAMKLPAFFDDGYHLNLPDCGPPHMGYRAGSVQPAAFGSWPPNAPCVLSAYEEIARPATASTSQTGMGKVNGAILAYDPPPAGKLRRARARHHRRALGGRGL
jgi:hypothetical protein